MLIHTHNKPLTRSEFARMIDHTALKPETTKKQIEQLCEEARQFCFGAVCVAPSWIPLAVARLAGCSVRVASVVGFPHGNTLSAAKASEATKVLEAGADELDMVIHVGALKSRDQKAVIEDIRAVVEVAKRKPDTIVKVILETALLTDDEKVLGCQLAEKAGANFVKTSTGFAARGATLEDVVLMRHIVQDRLGVKAAGGIGNLTTARAMMEAGATRLGCSASVSIIKEFHENQRGHAQL